MRPFTVAATTGVATDEVDVTVQTSDLSLDADGTVVMPVFRFQVVIASPTIASAAASGTNPVTLDLEITLRHPCRDAVFTDQAIPAITAVVNYGPTSATVAPFAHSFDGTATDCGL